MLDQPRVMPVRPLAAPDCAIPDRLRTTTLRTLIDALECKMMTKSLYRTLPLLGIMLLVAAMLLAERHWGQPVKSIIGLISLGVIGPLLWRSRNRELKDWRYRLALGSLFIMWVLMLVVGVSELIAPFA